MRRASFSLLSRLTETISSRQKPFPKCSLQTLSHNAPPLPLPLPTRGQQLLTTFNSLESSLNLDSPGPDDLPKALNSALEALQTFESDDPRSIFVAKTLSLIGSISHKLGKFDYSLKSLETAEKILSRLENDRFGGSDITSNTLQVQVRLAETNSAMGRKVDALANLQKALELRRAMLEPDSEELAAAYKELAEAHVVVSEFAEALPLCLKALDILKTRFGKDSGEVVHTRRLLGAIYLGLSRIEEALEQNDISLGILKCLGLEEEILDLEIEAANVKIAMGRSSEAVETLKSTIQRAGKESKARAFVFVSMAKALCSQEKFGDSKRCLEIACGVLNKLGSGSASSSKVFEAYAEISMMYELMNDFETAISLMKRTITIVEKHPREKHLEGSISARVGWLLLLTGRADQAVTYLERARERLEESFGVMHFGFGFACKHLGQAYLETGRPTQAVATLETAYKVLVRSFGPDHEDTIDACQSLANAYAAKASFFMEFRQNNYTSAMGFQQRVIDAWQSRGPNARDELREAQRLLEQLKRKAQGSLSAVFPVNTLPFQKCK